MAKDPDNLAGDLGAESTGGPFTGLIADEDEFDRRMLWRLGSWGVAAVGAVTLTVFANQSSLVWRRDQVAATEVARHAQQIRMLAKESQNETRRLAAAIETLNSDRDRLYARMTSLEQGFESVTGAVAKQGTAPPSPSPLPATQPSWLPAGPIVAPVAAAPAVPMAIEQPAADKSPAIVADRPSPASDKKPAERAPVTVSEAAPAAEAASGDIEAAKAETLPKIPSVAAEGMIGPPEPPAGKPVEPDKPATAVMANPAPGAFAAAPAAVAPDGEKSKTDDTAAPKVDVQRTEFGVDLGGANSVAGLRALWHGLLKSRANAPLFNLRPIIVIKEGANGFGMQLRLVAGPLRDAGAAARICAALAESKRSCETTVFDGQRLTLKDEPPAAATSVPARPPAPHRRAVPPPLPPLPKRAAASPEPEEPKKPETTAASAVSALSTLFGRKEQ